MEDFIDYVIHCLMTCEVKSRKTTVAGKSAWVMVFNDSVIMTFDSGDVGVVRSIYENRKYILNDDERDKYQRFFSICQ